MIRALALRQLSVAEAQAQANLCGKLIQLVALRLRWGSRGGVHGDDLTIFTAEVQAALGAPPPDSDHPQ